MRDRFSAPAAILGLALVAAAALLAVTWRGNVKVAQTINVTGSAKQEIVSDFGMFRCSVRAEAPTAEAAYRQLLAARPRLLDFFATRGFPADQVRTFPMSNYAMPELTENGRETGRVLKYVYNQRFETQSSDVKAVEALSLAVGSLIEQGIYVEPEMPEYHYSKLAELKIEVQALAARDAAVRARKVAEASGARLGVIRSAKMGVLQITPRHSNMVSDYGINDLSSIEKEITAVVQAQFSIE